MTRIALVAVALLAFMSVAAAQTADPKVLEAQRLKRLNGLLNPDAARQVVAIGQPVPDFTLKDQQGTLVSLSSLKGKVAVATFGYIRCPNPAYCFRLASNLGQVQSRLKERLGQDLILLTVMLDPEHDQDRALAEYAHVWTLQPAAWHFLTGPVPDVRRVAGYFGVEFYKDEGSVMHSLNTVVVDRQGRLAASLEGNMFSANQLLDIVIKALDRR